MYQFFSNNNIFTNNCPQTPMTTMIMTTPTIQTNEDCIGSFLASQMSQKSHQVWAWNWSNLLNLGVPFSVQSELKTKNFVCLFCLDLMCIQQFFFSNSCHGNWSAWVRRYSPCTSHLKPRTLYLHLAPWICGGYQKVIWLNLASSTWQWWQLPW